MKKKIKADKLKQNICTQRKRSMQQQTITWYKPNEMPESWKDGRELLCRVSNGNSTWCEILFYYKDDEEIFIGTLDDDHERLPGEIDLIAALDEINNLVVMK